MTERQKEILGAIVKEHVETSKPVGSKVILGKLGISLSSATIRSEMVKLEKEGLIQQPHTSAGRVPTDKAYRWYIKSLGKKSLSEHEQEALKRKLNSFEDPERQLRMIADTLSELTYCTAVVTLSSQDVYTRGFGYMMRNPEFEERNRALSVADLFDHLSEFMNNLPKISKDVLYVGEDNPYLRKANCSLLVAPYRMHDREGVIGILGPARMSYEKNISLLDFITESLGEF